MAYCFLHAGKTYSRYDKWVVTTLYLLFLIQSADFFPLLPTSWGHKSSLSDCPPKNEKSLPRSRPGTTPIWLAFENVSDEIGDRKLTGSSPGYKKMCWKKILLHCQCKQLWIFPMRSLQCPAQVVLFKWQLSPSHCQCPFQTSFSHWSLEVCVGNLLLAGISQDKPGHAKTFQMTCCCDYAIKNFLQYGPFELYEWFFFFSFWSIKAFQLGLDDALPLFWAASEPAGQCTLGNNKEFRND